MSSSDFPQFIKVGEVLKNTLERIDRSYPRQGKTIETGLTALDELTGGFRSSDLIVIGGVSAMGKTFLAISIALNLVLNKKPVAYFNLESEADDLAQKLLVVVAETSPLKMKEANLTDNEWKMLTKSFGKLSQAPLYINDTENISVKEIIDAIQKMSSVGSPDLVVIDYLQLIKEATTPSRLSETARRLKDTALKYTIPILITSQLCRKVMFRKREKGFELADLRGSRAIGQEADTVIFIHREDYFKPRQQRKEMQEMELIVAKHPEGKTGTVKVLFNHENGRIKDM